MSDTDTDDTTTDEEDSQVDRIHEEDFETAGDEHERTGINPGGDGALTGPQADEYDPITLYDQQRHRNGDESVLLICTFADGYQVIAFDVDAGGQLLEIDPVGDTQDMDKAVGMAEYWLDQNPDGVLGGAPADGGGLLEKLGFGGGDEP